MTPVGSPTGISEHLVEMELTNLFCVCRIKAKNSLLLGQLAQGNVSQGFTVRRTGREQIVSFEGQGFLHRRGDHASVLGVYNGRVNIAYCTRSGEEELTVLGQTHRL